MPNVKNNMIALLLPLALLGCSRESPVAVADKPPNPPLKPTQVSEAGRRTLVVYNRLAAGSQALAEFYADRRGLPPENIVRTATVTTETMPHIEVTANLIGELNNKIKALNGIGRQIDFIVLAKGVPIRVWTERNFSVDGFLAAMDLPAMEHAKNDPPSREDVMRIANPYFGKDEPFTSKKFGFYLVTRLEGYTFEDARALIENSLASKPHKGPFLFDSDPGRQTGGYKLLEDSMAAATQKLQGKGFEVVHERTNTFLKPGSPIAGYSSWGSNDGHFDLGNYRGLRFKPGAIAETFVSTSGRTFVPGTEGGQSLIADLIKSGITGVKGYVNEPYAFALARPDILFDRYTRGYTLAESFYMASPLLKWRDLVVGDALCAPYKK